MILIMAYTLLHFVRNLDYRQFGIILKKGQLMLVFFLSAVRGYPLFVVDINFIVALTLLIFFRSKKSMSHLGLRLLIFVVSN